MPTGVEHITGELTVHLQPGDFPFDADRRLAHSRPINSQGWRSVISPSMPTGVEHIIFSSPLLPLASSFPFHSEQALTKPHALRLHDPRPVISPSMPTGVEHNTMPRSSITLPW